MICLTLEFFSQRGQYYFFCLTNQSRATCLSQNFWPLQHFIAIGSLIICFDFAHYVSVRCSANYPSFKLFKNFLSSSLILTFFQGPNFGGWYEELSGPIYSRTIIESFPYLYFISFPLQNVKIIVTPITTTVITIAIMLIMLISAPISNFKSR